MQVGWTVLFVRNGARLYRSNRSELLSPRQIHILRELQRGPIAYVPELFGLQRASRRQDDRDGSPRAAIYRSVKRLAARGLINIRDSDGSVRLTRDGERVTTWLFEQLRHYTTPARPSWTNEILAA